MSLKISRILHAGYIFECEDKTVAFDPIFENPFSRNCHAFPPVQFNCEQIRNLNLSAIFISHFHDDHCSLESLHLLKRQTPLYVYCLYDELFAMIRELGFTHVHPLELDQTVTIGSMKITPRRALDAEVDSMFQIQATGLNVLNVVDSWMDPETLTKLCQQPPWDLILWPFQTMREIEVIAPRRAPVTPATLPAEWLMQLQALNPRLVVPSSCQFTLEPWSWYNQAFFPISYRHFTEQMNRTLPHSQVFRMDPGAAIMLSKDKALPASPLSWVQRLDKEVVDYNYQPELPAPSTAQIAQHFAALDEAQTEAVWNYCLSGIMQKYQALEAPLDEYFDKPRFWRLSVYDHTGRVKHFFYRVDGRKIDLIDTIPTDDLGWSTEVPLAKLYAALEEGESLTSMYMRINDITFSSEIEAQIQNADIVDDPLIRCLFNGAFGTYQAAQLKRLKARSN